MSTFLLEIGCEEIPAHFMSDALAQLKQKGRDLLQQYRLSHDDVRVYGTPRRLAFLAKGISQRQSDAEQKVKGPAKKAAYDAEGQPTKALLGFMRSQGVDIDDLTIEELNGVPYVYAHKIERGLPAMDVLSKLAPQLIMSLNFPKSMRWGDKEIRFVRPIRWIAALLDNEVVPFDIDGIHSGRCTRGHRFLAPTETALNCADDYLSVMEGLYVIADQERRMNIIEEQVKDVASSVNGHVLKDDDLLEEVVYLVEYPTAFIGAFDAEYLKLPQEVVITPMKDHQRYFQVMDPDGKLMPNFIAIKNGTADYIDIVREGNEKVLKARLDDAKFFFEEDIKRPLEQRVDELKGVIFHDGLGTLHDKTMRLQSLSVYLAKSMGVSNEILIHIERAAYLSRADLVTEMVNEFDELQGVMGREYAKLQGEPEEVAQAIYEMYLPRSAGDKLPQSLTGAIVSIADKLDTICGYFSIGLQPTGSQDPYALRRQALGVCRIIYEKGISISLVDTIKYDLKLYDLDEETASKTLHDVLEFMKQRVRLMLIDEGISYDAVDAAITAQFDDIYEVRKRAKVIDDWKKRQDFEDFLIAFNRPNNLAGKVDNIAVNEEAFLDPTEGKLWQAYKEAKATVEEALAEGNYERAYETLKSLKPAIDEFFDAVLVMADDPKVRDNRLAILNNIAALFKKIGDFSCIAI